MLRGMLRGTFFAAVLVLFIVTISAQAQSSDALKNHGIIRYEISKKGGIKPLDTGDIFISPKDSLLKLQRQVEFHMLPATFSPAVETEMESFKRKALRYAVVYYRDSEVPGISGFRDVLLGI